MLCPVSFVAPFACAAPRRAPVPSTAVTAATQIQTAVRTALANGKRRLSVDMLMAGIDARSRTFDEHSAEIIFDSMITSIQPILPSGAGEIRVVVAGATTALRVRSWLTRRRLSDVSVTVLGMDVEDGGAFALHSSNTPDLSATDLLDVGERGAVRGDLDDLDGVGALLVLSPPAKGSAIDDLRHLLRQAHNRNLPVVVHNHPREEAVYQLLGYGGTIPLEMWQYEPVFVLAPFAMRQNVTNTAQNQNVKQPPRFVLMRQYPGDWGLWCHNGPSAYDMPEESDASAPYVLCGEFNRRPSDGRILHTVAKTMREIGKT